MNQNRSDVLIDQGSLKVGSHDPFSGANYHSNSKKLVTGINILSAETIPEK